MKYLLTCIDAYFFNNSASFWLISSGRSDHVKTVLSFLGEMQDWSMLCSASVMSRDSDDLAEVSDLLHCRTFHRQVIFTCIWWRAMGITHDEVHKALNSRRMRICDCFPVFHILRIFLVLFFACTSCLCRVLCWMCVYLFIFLSWGTIYLYLLSQTRMSALKIYTRRRSSEKFRSQTARHPVTWSWKMSGNISWTRAMLS